MSWRDLDLHISAEFARHQETQEARMFDYLEAQRVERRARKTELQLERRRLARAIAAPAPAEPAPVRQPSLFDVTETVRPARVAPARVRIRTGEALNSERSS